MHRAQCLPRVVGREWVDAEPDRHRQTGRQTARQKPCSLCNVTHPALGARPSQPRANRVTDQQYAGITRGLWSSPSPTPPPPPELCPAAAAQIPLSLLPSGCSALGLSAPPGGAPDPHWISQHFPVCLEPGSPALGAVLQLCHPHCRAELGSTSLPCWPCSGEPRAFWATRAHCWLVVTCWSTAG